MAAVGVERYSTGLESVRGVAKLHPVVFFAAMGAVYAFVASFGCCCCCCCVVVVVVVVVACVVIACVVVACAVVACVVLALEVSIRVGVIGLGVIEGVAVALFV